MIINKIKNNNNNKKYYLFKVIYNKLNNKNKKELKI